MPTCAGARDGSGNGLAHQRLLDNHSAIFSQYPDPKGQKVDSKALAEAFAFRVSVGGRQQLPHTRMYKVVEAAQHLVHRSAPIGHQADQQLNLLHQVATEAFALPSRA